jgi:hypothetical protein
MEKRSLGESEAVRSLFSSQQFLIVAREKMRMLRVK